MNSTRLVSWTAAVIMLIAGCAHSEPVWVSYHGIRPTDPEGRSGLRNPERGLRIETLIGEPLGATGFGHMGAPAYLRDSAPEGYSDEWWVQDARHHAEHGLTLALTYCYLDRYCSGPLPPQKIADISRSIERLRLEGMKAVLRFAYEKSSTAPDGPDAATILSHIGQLKPILHEYADVILVLQAGFVGAWGEWHHSFRNIESDPAALASIVAAELDALPKHRMLQMRTPQLRQLVLSQASTPVDALRIGFHNDGFLAGPTAGNTWPEPPHFGAPGNPMFDVMTDVSPFVYVDGEMFVRDLGGEVDGLDAAAQMALHHYTSFSITHSYSLYEEDQPRSIDRWMRTPVTPEQLAALRLPISDGYFDDGSGGTAERTIFEYIRDHLGYRLELQRGGWPAQTRAGKAFPLQIELINRGFATLHNPRHVQVVLLDAQGRAIECSVIDANPRDWQPHAPDDPERRPLVHTLNRRVTVPASLEPGEYQVALWLPDAAPTLRYDPRYAVRLANRDTAWRLDASERYGVNVLGTIQVER